MISVKEHLQQLAQQPGSGPLPLSQCPEAGALGACLILADAQGSRIELGFELAEHFIQGAGVIQGGVLATMLDLALQTVARHALPPGRAPSRATLNVSLLRACDAGPVRAEAVIERAGRSVVFAQARLFNPQGQCLATGSAAMPVREQA